MRRRRLQIRAATARMLIPRPPPVKHARATCPGIIDRADTVPADAEGNNSVVDLAADEQVKNFQLSEKDRGVSDAWVL